MITDIFLKRYPERWISSQEAVPPPLQMLVRQASLVLVQDISLKIPERPRFFQVPEHRLARELGEMVIGAGPSPEARVHRFLSETYDLWNDQHRDPDTFFKLRLSLIELMFQEAEAILIQYAPNQDLKGWWALLQKRVNPLGRTNQEVALAAVVSAKAEINQRFKDANFPFEYHSGVIQRVDDPLIAEEVEKPFWELVSAPPFSNVASDIKEAIDRRDSGKPDAAFHALKGLESVIKILSDGLGRTRGTERGAADYIDNLVSSKLGRFIETWEADTLKGLFRDIRNPLGHGAGAASQFGLSHDQTVWAIEACMSWIKSLVRRSTRQSAP